MGWSIERHARSERPPGRTAEAAQRTAAVQERVQAAAGRPRRRARRSRCSGTDLQTLKRAPRRAPPTVRDRPICVPRPGPVWAAFAPNRPGPFAGWFGGKRRYARRLAEAEDRFADAIERHRTAEETRRERVARATRDQAEQQRRLDDDTAEQHARIDEYQRAVRVARPARGQPVLPEGARPSCRAARLPTPPAGPAMCPSPPCWRWSGTCRTSPSYRPKAAYRYDKEQRRGGRRCRGRRARCGCSTSSLVAQLALRALHLAFGNDRYGVVETVVFNGMVRVGGPGYRADRAAVPDHPAGHPRAVQGAGARPARPGRLRPALLRRGGVPASGGAAAGRAGAGLRPGGSAHDRAGRT